LSIPFDLVEAIGHQGTQPNRFLRVKVTATP
jgi:hypothetical protein